VKNTLTDRVAFLISSLGIMKMDFARRTEYTQSYISMVLSGTIPDPGPRFINAVCREFNVNPEWLTDGKEPVFTVPGLSLSPDRAEVLAKMNLLSEGKRKLILDIINAFLVDDMVGEKGKKPVRKGRKSGGTPAEKNAKAGHKRKK
jgi:transcriptional regulator with XRE-family HTH domain